MANNKATHVTGAADNDESLRRRNVDSHREINGTISVSQVEVDDKKSQKVCNALARVLDHWNQSLINSLQLKAKPADSSILQFLDEYEFLLAPLVFTALAFFTRMWKIGLSDIVTWDEAQ